MKFPWIFKKKPDLIPTVMPSKTETELRADLLRVLVAAHEKTTQNITNRCVFLALTTIMTDRIAQDIMSKRAYRSMRRRSSIKNSSEMADCLMEYRDNLYNKASIGLLLTK